MKTKMLVLGAFIAGILSAFFGGKAFATAGNTAEIPSGTWEICVNATLDSQSPDFSLDITKSGFESQLVLGGGECKTVKLTGSSAYTVSLGSTMGASSVDYEVSEGSLTFNVANSLNNYLNAFGSVTYTTEGSGEETDYELLFSMPGTCYLNGNANVSGDTCKDGDGNPLTDKKYIDTGVALFSEANAARDFEIYFTLDDYASTQPNNQGTLFNAKYEDSSMLYPGFTLRMSGSNVQTMELTGRIGNDNTDADKAKKNISTESLKGKEMKIVRVGGLVSYSIDGGELIEFQNYQNFSRYFEQNAVFGASLQTNGNPQRYYDGTVSNIRIYLKKLEEETTGNIEFDANGGTGTMAKIEDIELGTDVTLPANMFTKKNANFTGWNTAADGSGTAYTDEGTVTISEVGKLTLYAQWENIPVGSIEFNANGGSGTMSVIADIPVGTNASLPANTFTMKNGTFTGWNTAADGSGVDYADEATVAITSTSRIYLYAQWEIRPVGSIAFNANGGSGTMAVIEDIDINTSVTLPANTYTLTNATFKGWNTRLDGTGTDYADEATITVSSTDRVTLYAQWDGKAVLASSFTVHEKLRSLASGYSTNLFAPEYKIKSIKEANALPDDTVSRSVISNTDKTISPVTIYAWFDNSDRDGDGQGDGVMNIFTTAEKIESGTGSLDYLFDSFYSLSDISALENWDISNSTTIAYMFYQAESLSDISPLAHWNTSNIKNMKYAFYSTAITNVDALETKQHEGKDYVSWDVSNVTNMSCTFYNANPLSDISALSTWNTSKVTDMQAMFYGTAITNTNALETKQHEGKDYVSWDTSKVANMTSLFSSSRSLSDISALATWNTSMATSLAGMFSGTAITNTDALETKQYDGRDYVSWDISNAESISGMFSYASLLTDITSLATWNTSKVTNMSNIFRSAKSLSNVTPLANWDTSKATNMNSLFASTISLVNISPISVWDTSSVTSMNEMFLESVITDVDALETKQHEGKSYVSWDVSKVGTMDGMFRSAKSLSEISALSSWSTSSLTSMSRMFESAIALIDVTPLSSWNTSGVTNMSSLFESASSLSNISALSSWNTSGVTNMSSLFKSASSISDISALASWNTSSLENMKYAFYSTAITNVDALETKQHEGKDYVSWDTSKVTNMVSLFASSRSLSDISALASWNTSSVTDMSIMFAQTGIINTNALETKQHEGKDYVSWDTSKVTDMSSMFSADFSLTDISALASWNVSSVTNMNDMFQSSTLIEDVSILECWNVSWSVTKYSMFYAVHARPLPSWYPYPN